MLRKSRIRFTNKKYECIRNYDKNSVGGVMGGGEEEENKSLNPMQLIYGSQNLMLEKKTALDLPI